jgi:hypothetical protein
MVEHGSAGMILSVCLLSRRFSQWLRRLKDLLMSRSKYRMSRDALPSPAPKTNRTDPLEKQQGERTALTRKKTTTEDQGKN